MTRTGQFVPLNQQKRYRDRLIKFTIAASKFAELRRDLDRCGVNHASIFADIDGVAHHIAWTHTWFEDEEIDLGRSSHDADYRTLRGR